MANKVAVLGSNGVIGNFLSQRLEGYQITSINRQILDLSNTYQVKDYFKNHYYDIVINCAANINSDFNAPISVATDNFVMFSNLYQARNNFGRYINFCSGAAFDRNRSIDNADEEVILTRKPNDPYGMSKNIISRICLYTENFYTIRIFGTFYYQENSKRLLPKILNKENIVIQDRYFDYFYLEDLLPLVNYLIKDNSPQFKDINAVYQNKLLLSEFVTGFCNIHSIDMSHITINSTEINNMINYTGSAKRYSSLNLSAIGIENGMKKYK